jgi:hypothetical protein
MIIWCCCCGKQALFSETPSRYDKDVTAGKGGRAGFKNDEIFCAYCAEDIDENGLFPEERMQLTEEERDSYDS